MLGADETMHGIKQNNQSSLIFQCTSCGRTTTSCSSATNSTTDSSPTNPTFAQETTCATDSSATNSTFATDISATEARVTYTSATDIRVANIVATDNRLSPSSCAEDIRAVSKNSYKRFSNRFKVFPSILL